MLNLILVINSAVRVNVTFWYKLVKSVLNVSFTAINILCDLMSMFATNRCIFVPDCVV